MRTIKLKFPFAKKLVAYTLFLLILNLNSFSQTTLGPGDYTLCIKNMHQTTDRELLFDIYIQWDNPGKLQKFNFFSGGLNFNYAGLSNGGVISAQFVAGSADPGVPAAAQNPTWSLHQTSKQIRFLAAIVSPNTMSAPVPSAPGWKLGTLRLFNTVPFASVQPDFVWDYTTGANKTQTREGFWMTNDGGASWTAVAYIDNNPPGSNHCSIPNTSCGVPCPTVNAGGPYITCGDVHLNGTVIFAPSFIWSSNGTGSFDPNPNTLNATYHPSSTDLVTGVTLTLTTGTYFCCPVPTVSSTQVNFVSTDDNNVCTTDACDQSTGNPTHTPVNTDDGISCTIDGCNSITGVYHTPDNCFVTLNSNIFLEGYYLGGGEMSNCLFITGVSSNPDDADVITINAMNASSPYGLIESQTGILKKDGNVSVTFGSSIQVNSSYFLKVTHRNAITTWSGTPVLMSPVTNYIFSDAINKAYGKNQVATHLSGSGPDGFGFAFYSGDIGDGNPPGSGVQDGTIDATDFLDLDVFIQNGDSGYLIADLNGDGSVDASDFLVLESNIQMGVGASGPTP